VIAAGRPPRRRIGRQTFWGASLASVLVHALAVAVYFVALREDKKPPAPPPEPPAIQVEILADPRAGMADASDSAETPPPEPPPEPVQQATPPAPEPKPTRQADLPAELAEPNPPPPPPPAPPERHATPPRPQLPPPRLPSGASAEGREQGLTDIILGDNTVPPGEDPTAQNIPPRYPPEAVRRGQQGSVQLIVVVGTDGRALTVDVAVSSGYPLLDRAAREAVAKWRFRPGSQDGLAMPATLPVTLQFTLVDHR